MAKELALIVRLDPKEGGTTQPELVQLAERVASSGYPMRPNPDLLAMANQRIEHMSCVDALAAHLGAPSAVLVRQS